MISMAEALRRAGLVTDEEVAKAEEVKEELREADEKLLSCLHERNPLVLQEKIQKIEKTYSRLDRVKITRARP
jgi:predicted nuclease with TOPRIM domain